MRTTKRLGVAKPASSLPDGSASGPVHKHEVISVLAQKGGTGKATLSVAIACAAAADGLSTVIVDLDPQATASSWGDRRSFGHPVVLPAQPPRLPRVLDAAARAGVELAVVDTAPRVEQSAVAAARAADLVVVPCRPAVYDLETVVSTLDVVRAVAPGVRAVCILNGVPPRGPREGQARAALAAVGVEVCPASLGLRAVVDYAAAAGLSPQEHEPRSKAATEVAAIYRFVRGLTDQPSRRQDDSSAPQHPGFLARHQVDPADAQQPQHSSYSES